MHAITIRVRQTIQVFSDPDYGMRVAAACDAPNEPRPLLNPEDRTPLGNLDIA
jgi:hypothetical protein